MTQWKEEDPDWLSHNTYQINKDHKPVTNQATPVTKYAE